jgi:membrane protein DedA with SNARE-associated domain
MFDWMTGFQMKMGTLGIVPLMFAENVFPPIPSELIMPLAGFSAARGERNLIIAISAGSIGSLLGALLWYYIGKKLGAERLKRWATNMVDGSHLRRRRLTRRAIGSIVMAAKPSSSGGLFPRFEH